MLAHCVLLGCIVLLFQDVLSLRMKIEPHNPMVLPGQNVSILCQADHPLLYCRIILPSLSSALSLTPRTTTREYAYYGAGLKEGQCGVTLFKVADKFSGEVTCTGAPEDEPYEVTAQTSVTVLRGPKTPVLVVTSSPTTRNNRVFKEGEVLTASCVVQDGRPIANISWYLGNDRLTAGIKTEKSTNPQTNLHTVKQVVHRQLGWRDDSKELRCVAHHVAMATTNHSAKTVSVTYPPRYVKLPIELYGFTINKTGNVTVQILANPKPSFVWIIGKTQLPEGQTYPGGNLEALRAEFLGNGEWRVVLLIHKVTREDIDREYHLQARNSEGHRTYLIILSTAAAAPFKFGIWMIIATVVVAVLVLVVAVTVYVFVAGRRNRMTYSPTNEGMSKVTGDAPTLT